MGYLIEESLIFCTGGQVPFFDEVVSKRGEMVLLLMKLSTVDFLIYI